MGEQDLQKNKVSSLVKDKGQYALAILIVASMLFVTNIPVLVIFFFGIFIFFVMRTLSGGPRNGVREIFEFYLSAHEILRDDDRRWYGFEIQETITKGEQILSSMGAAPPLVRFTLGALHHKFGDHKAAVSYLSQVIENPSADEMAYVYPSQELRHYVKILRRIEREPANAPMMSAAIRALERARKVRGAELLESSRASFAASDNLRSAAQIAKHAEADRQHSVAPEVSQEFEGKEGALATLFSIGNDAPKTSRKRRKKDREEEFADRQPISEVLHDIYDRNH